MEVSLSLSYFLLQHFSLLPVLVRLLLPFMPNLTFKKVTKVENYCKNKSNLMSPAARCWSQTWWRCRQWSCNERSHFLSSCSSPPNTCDQVFLRQIREETHWFCKSWVCCNPTKKQLNKVMTREYMLMYESNTDDSVTLYISLYMCFMVP